MAYHKILAAVDESPAGAHALRAGSQIAVAARARLVLLRVVDDPWRFIEPGEVEAKRAMRDGSWAKVAAARVTDELSQLTGSTGVESSRITLAVRFGIPGLEIPRWAQLEGADLIVLGRQPPGALERRPAGRTLEGVLQRATMPCLVVPFGQRTWHRVLVLAEDGVAVSDILERTFAFAEAFHSEVTVVEVEPELALVAAGRSEAVARKAFALWGRLPHTGSFDVIVRQGDAAGEMLKLARDEHADLVVVGYHRGESLEHAGIAGRIVLRAPCAVLTVPT